MSSSPFLLGWGLDGPVYVSTYTGPINATSRSRRRLQLRAGDVVVSLSLEEADTLAEYIKRNSGPVAVDR